MVMPTEIVVVENFAGNSRSLFVDRQLVVQSDPNLGDPLYLVDEAAEHLAMIYQLPVQRMFSNNGIIDSEGASN